jgi:type IV fimbrial biogenesis protein FimT
MNTRRTTHRTSPRRRLAGLTLIESAVATSIVATAASLVAPALTQVKARHQVISAAAEFETDVHYARSLAVTRNATLRINFGSSTDGACYVIHTGAANARCDCMVEGAARCEGAPEILRSVRIDARNGLQLASNVRTITFDPIDGTSTPAGTVRFTGQDGRALHQVVNIMGRVRSCSPARAIAGYKAC